MHAFILAGGFATRLWPLTEKRAKPLLPLAGKPILSHIVNQIPEHIPVVVSTNASFKESFHEWQKTMNRKNLEVRIEQTTSDDEKLGTLGATAQWIEQEKIDDDILLLTGDNYFGFNMNTFIDQFSGSALVAAYDIQNTEQAKSFGTIILETDKKHIAAFEEKPKEPKSTLVSTGCSILPASTLDDLRAFAKIKPDNVGGIFEELLRLKKSVECFTFSEPWFDIGSFDAYLEATHTLVGNNVITNESSKLTHTETEGSVVIGNNCTISKSILRNVVLFGDCTIENCVLERCIIDSGCILRNVDLTGKMLREKTRLEGLLRES